MIYEWTIYYSLISFHIALEAVEAIDPVLMNTLQCTIIATGASKESELHILYMLCECRGANHYGKKALFGLALITLEFQTLFPYKWESRFIAVKQLEIPFCMGISFLRCKFLCYFGYTAFQVIGPSEWILQSQIEITFPVFPSTQSNCSLWSNKN